MEIAKIIGNFLIFLVFFIVMVSGGMILFEWLVEIIHYALT